jgi:PEP-CTERM motif
MRGIEQSVNVMAGIIKFLLSVCVLGVYALNPSAVFAASCPDLAAYPLNGCSLPGLVNGSYPFFLQNVTVTLKSKKDGNFRLKAKSFGAVARKSTLYFSPSIDDTYAIDKTFFRFKTRYSNGKLTGKIRIKGKMPELGINKRQILMRADLKGEWNSTGRLIGFNTMNIECHAAINAVAPCTTDEVIYLSELKDVLNPGGTKGKYETTGLAVTSVPVPATVWLFGSGLIGLVGAARRKPA